ncbi:MAG: FAD-dependent oxidoreductase [Victivallaceae bacterium]|nr:FAD-dependent oxidoreductase [Victivallaceae bacterium]
MNTIDHTLKGIPVAGEFDVFVIGAGMAGVAAAIYAARSGLKTGLIEYFGEAGGVPVSGKLCSISGFSNNNVKTVGGFALEVVEELCRNGKAVSQRENNYNVDPIALSSLLCSKLEDAGVTILFYTQLIDAIRDGECAKFAVTASKSGIQAFASKLFIDASGDGDFAWHLGCPYEKGRKSDGKVQSSTLIFSISGIDENKMEDFQEIRKKWKLKERSVPINHTPIQFIPYNNDSHSELVINMTHIINCDCTNTEDLTRVRLEGFKQAEYILEFFKTEVAGFENSYIRQIANQAGVRETRRFIGDYILTEEDVVGGCSFEDEIARGSWGIDVHSPDKIHTGIEKQLKQSYGIPYRCITPKGISNLYIAGRPISVDHRAFSSTRINSTCSAIGQAAGTAAAMAIKSGDTRKIQIKQLKQQLITDGAIITP